MKQYDITGMSCAACSTRVEKAVKKVAGVEECTVNLLTNSMIVEGDVDSIVIIKAVEDAGYGACEKSDSENDIDENDTVHRETLVLRVRLGISLLLLAILMYFSMGHMMWNWPVPEYFSHTHMANGVLQLVLTVMIMLLNSKFFTNGLKGLLRLSPNMDTLVALGSGAAFVYSLYTLFYGDMHDLYFESAAMILTLITVGKMLESRSKGKTTDALKGLMKLAPKTAVVIRDGVEIIIPAATVKVGDIYVVKPGENIPVDGIVIEGTSAVNESALTGESIPVSKSAGDEVSAATINTSGYMKCRATRVGEDTTLAQIIRMVSDAAATKAPIAKVADKVSGVFVPVVIAIAIITTLVWIFIGESVGYALARGISVLVISCPCALGLATPVAIMVGNGVGAKHGIMFKTAASLEHAGRTTIVALDKTGTITSGNPVVTDIIPYGSYSENELLTNAYLLESRSEHPLGEAIVNYVKENKDSLAINTKEVTDFEVLPGNGLKANICNHNVIGGSYRYIRSILQNNSDNLSERIQSDYERLSEQGKTPLFFLEDGKLCGIIAVADAIKEDSPEAVANLKRMGMHVVMLTGDNERTAKAIGNQVGVDEVIAEVLPDGKENVIKELQLKGKVAMVGDGINDAPALTRADTGIAIGAGTDIAIDAADIVLMKNMLSDVPAAIKLSKATLRNIHQNLFWAFIYNIIGIPLAAGVYIPIMGWQLNPMFAAAAMSLSSFCVVTNALRLNGVKLYNKTIVKEENDKKENNEKVEESIMTKTMKIEGMMCGHCEARVKKTLEALEGVKEAVVSHENGTAVVTLDSEISNDILAKVIEDQDYKVLGIE